jgi:gliding motility-associated-like protein
MKKCQWSKSKYLYSLVIAVFFSSAVYGQTKPDNNTNFGISGVGGPVTAGLKMISAVESGLPFTFSFVSPIGTSGSVMYIGQPSSGGLFRPSNSALFFNYTYSSGNVIPGGAGGATGIGDYRLHFTQANPSDTGANKLGNFGLQSMYIAIGAANTADVVVQGFRAGRKVAQSTITGLSSDNESLASMSLTDLFYSASDEYSGVTVSFGSNWQFLDGIRFTINDRTIPLQIDDINFNDPSTIVPGTQASGLNFTNTTGITSTINWTKGSGDRSAVFIKATSSGTADIVPAIPPTPIYTPNTAFGSGSITPDGWSCVYSAMDNSAVLAGTANSVGVTNLTPGTTYRVMVVSFNGTGSYATYNTSENMGGLINAGNFSTVAVPTIQASNITVTPVYTDFRKAFITWTRGYGAKSAIFVKNNTPPGQTVSSTVAPPHNDNNTTQHTYSAFTDSVSVTNNGRVGATGWYCVFNGAGSGTGLSSSVNMTRITIQPGQTLRVMVVEYNGAAGAETYNITSASNNVVDYFNPDYPLPVTDAATAISTSAATLNGTIDPRNANITNGTYEYSLSSSLATILGTITTLTPAATSILGSASATAVAGSLTGLLPSTTYYYRLSATSNAGSLTATNSTGGATNGIQSFTTAPVVSSVSASTINGSYKAGQVVNVTVVFTSAVTVTGMPTLALNSGGTASYVSGSGSSTLSFNYPITGGESSADLDYAATSSLSLSGGTIKDGAGTDANLILPAPALANSLAGQKDIIIDTQTPTLTAVAIASNNTNTAIAKPGNIITLTITSVEPVSSPAVTIGGQAATVTGAGTAWSATYTMTTAQNTGDVAFDIAYSDIAGNAGATVTTTTNSSTVNFDKTIPTLGSVVIASNNANTALAKVGDVITIAFTSSEIIVGPTATVAGIAATVNGSGTSWTATRTMTATDVIGAVAFNISFDDLAGNPGAAVSTTSNGSSVTLADASIAVTPSSNANLGNLKIETATLSPLFDKSITTYTGALKNTNTTVTVIATAGEAGQTLKINGVGVQSDSATVLPAILGANNFEIVVTAADGITKKTYQATISRAKPNHAIPDATGAVIVSNQQKDVIVTSPTQELTVTVQPGTTDASVDYGALVTAGTGTLPKTTINTSSGSVRIPSATTVKASDPAWDGVISVPKITSYDFTPIEGQIITTGIVIEVGHPTISLSFDKAVRLLLPGQKGMRAAFIHNGLYTEISQIGTSDTQAAGDLLAPEAAFKMDVGNDLVIWTKAFSRFITFTQATDLNVAVVAADKVWLTADLIRGNNTDLDNVISPLADPLPATAPGGSAITWSSSNTAILTADGKTVSRPLFGSPAATVTLTAIIKKGLISQTSTFNLTVLPLPNQAPTIAGIANRSLCFTPAAQTIALSGITAGPESGQTTTLIVNSSTAGLLSGLAVNSTTGIITYTPANTAGGTTTITVTAKDNGGVANGGADTFVRSFTITINALPNAQIFNSIGTNDVSKGLTLTLTAAGGSTYSWANASGIVGGQNTAALTIRPTVNTTYVVTVTNASGCTSTQSVTINVVEDYLALEINNLMSPNGDGTNDNLVIKNLDLYPDNTVKIFDGAGRLLYTKRNYTNDWNGTFQGSQLAEDTYFYMVDFGAGKKVLKGFVSIVN